MNTNQDDLLRRTYYLEGGSPVYLIIYRPVTYADTQDAQCEYEILGLAKEFGRHVMGVDSMQSVLLALKVAAADLVSSDEYKSGNLYWLEAGNRDIGLPIKMN